MYVMTVARTGPASAIRAANRRNAAAVQTVARMTTAARAPLDGVTAGHWTAATGA